MSDLGDNWEETDVCIARGGTTHLLNELSATKIFRHCNTEVYLLAYPFETEQRTHWLLHWPGGQRATIGEDDPPFDWANAIVLRLAARSV